MAVPSSACCPEFKNIHFSTNSIQILYLVLYGRPYLLVLYARQNKKLLLWMIYCPLWVFTDTKITLWLIAFFKESLCATPPYPSTSLTSTDKCFKVLSVFQGLKHRCLFLVMLHAIDITANLLSSIGAPSRHDLLGKRGSCEGFLRSWFQSKPSFREFILILFHFSTNDLYTDNSHLPDYKRS